MHLISFKHLVLVEKEVCMRNSDMCTTVIPAHGGNSEGNADSVAKALPYLGYRETGASDAKPLAAGVTDYKADLDGKRMVYSGALERSILIGVLVRRRTMSQAL
jgi:hypothetical protein